MYQNRNKQPEQPSKNVQQQQLKDKENKLFGRSAYHVAIAYHIHLKKLKEHGDIIKNS